MKKITLSKIIIPIILLTVSILCVLPFLMIVFTSFASEEGLMQYGYSFFPHLPTLKSYEYIMSNGTQLWSAYGLTIFVTVVGTFLGIIFMTTCAYALSRDDFKLKKFLSFFIYFTMLFSGGTVASYIWIARYLKLSNNIVVLFLPIMMSAYNIFILRVSCKSIPYSLIECAKLEGAGEWYIFVRIVVPLAKTGIATIALLTMFTLWNDWYNSMMYMDTSDKCTLQYYLVKILDSITFAKANASASGGLSQASELPDEGVRMAICSLAAIPMLCVFPFFQKYFVKGITVGSVKG
ncbi:MAG: carbohydrate ABC transporter permease [Ruminococcaceae bacterium]|nr:carbohydrate ABC transporter permease [Oscillospiraceae bacterium]